MFSFSMTQFEINLGQTEILVMPGDPGDPYWNAGCIPVPSTYI